MCGWGPQGASRRPTGREPQYLLTAGNSCPLMEWTLVTLQDLPDERAARIESADVLRQKQRVEGGGAGEGGPGVPRPW